MINAVTSATYRPVPPASSKVAAGGGTSAASKQSALDRFAPTSSRGMVDTASMLGRLGNAGHTAVKGGAAALPGVQGVWSALKSFDLSGIWSAAKGLGQTAMTWGGRSAMFQGAISLVSNGYRSIKGTQSWADTGTKVVSDTVTGAVGGAAGAIAGGIGTMALTALGIAGGPLTIGAAVIGMGGYFLGERLFKQSALFCKFKNFVSGLMHDGLKPLST